jgi:hypothetical protein
MGDSVGSAGAALGDAVSGDVPGEREAVRASSLFFFTFMYASRNNNDARFQLNDYKFPHLVPAQIN